MTTTASYAHLVGSVPLADAESVFRAVCAEIGPHLAASPTARPASASVDRIPA